MTTSQTPILLSPRTEQDLRAMAAMLGQTLEETFAEFQERYLIVPAGSIDVRAHKLALEVKDRKPILESPSGHLEHLLYANLEGQFYGRGWQDRLPHRISPKK